MKQGVFKLSVLVSGLMVGSSAVAQSSSVTLYGVIDTSIQVMTNVGQRGANGAYLRDEFGNVVTSTKTSMESNKRQSSRWGLRGTEDLGGGLKTVFVLESGFNSDTGGGPISGGLFGRSAYVGLDHDVYGRFTFGRQYTAMLEHFSAFEPYSVPGNGIVSAHTTKYTDGVRANNALAYHGTFNGFYVTGVFGMGEQPGSLMRDSTGSIGFGYGTKDFKIGFAHFGHRNKCFSINPSDCSVAKGDLYRDTPRAYSVAGYYNFTDKITGYLGYLENDYRKSSQEDSMVWAGVKATVDNWVLIGAIYHDKTKHAGVTTQADSPRGIPITKRYDSGTMTTYSVSAEYRLSKRTGIYTELDLTRAKEALRYGVGAITDEQASQTALNVGIRHSF